MLHPYVIIGRGYYVYFPPSPIIVASRSLRASWYRCLYSRLLTLGYVRVGGVVCGFLCTPHTVVMLDVLMLHSFSCGRSGNKCKISILNFFIVQLHSSFHFFSSIFPFSRPRQRAEVKNILSPSSSYRLHRERCNANDCQVCYIYTCDTRYHTITTSGHQDRDFRGSTVQQALKKRVRPRYEYEYRCSVSSSELYRRGWIFYSNFRIQIIPHRSILNPV